jgi:hypothetical protein
MKGACLALYASCWLPLAAFAQSPPSAERPPHILVRQDAILNISPRYVLQTSDTATSAAARFWHRVEQMPVYERVSLDAEGLADGAVETHVLAWAAGDVLVPRGGQAVNGDFATAYGRAQLLPPLGAWVGRRFVTWGLPGGLHLDGAGAEYRSKIGVHAEALAGRPVTSAFTTLGAHSEFRQPTFAYGARVGYEEPGYLSADVSYLERAAEGITADRTLMGTVAYRPHPRVDVFGSSSVDVSRGLQEARVEVAYLATADLEPDLGYIHADPQKLLPSWSLLSMFASDAYDEGEVGVTTRFSPAITGRVELALRHAYLPGNEHHDNDYGHRENALVRVAPYGGGTQLVLEVSRRQLGATALLITRAAASFPAYRTLRVAPELGAAFDEHDKNRNAVLARAAAELPIGLRWRTALTLDFARTPIALAEVRSMLRVTYSFETGAR